MLTEIEAGGRCGGRHREGEQGRKMSRKERNHMRGKGVRNDSYEVREKKGPKKKREIN